MLRGRQVVEHVPVRRQSERILLQVLARVLPHVWHRLTSSSLRLLHQLVWNAMVWCEEALQRTVVGQGPHVGSVFRLLVKLGVLLLRHLPLQHLLLQHGLDILVAIWIRELLTMAHHIHILICHHSELLLHVGVRHVLAGRLRLLLGRVHGAVRVHAFSHMLTMLIL